MATEGGGRAIGRVDAKEVRPHNEGWDKALDRALERAAQDLGTGEYDVVVQFRAHLSVTNPGQILRYEVSLERTTT